MSRNALERVHPWVLRWGRVLLHDISSPVEGTIVTGAVIAVVGTHAARPGRVAVACVVVLAVYWLTHVYLHALREQYDRAADRLHVRLARHVGLQVGVLAGGVPAVAVLLVASWAGADMTSAAYLALAWTTLQLVLIVFVTSRAAGLPFRRALAESAVAGLIGALLAGAKSLLH